MVVRWDHRYGDEARYDYSQLARAIFELHQRFCNSS